MLNHMGETSVFFFKPSFFDLSVICSDKPASTGDARVSRAEDIHRGFLPRREEVMIYL